MRGERAEERERKEKEEKTKEGEDNRSKESGRRVGDLGWWRGSSEVRRKSEEVGTRVFS